MAVSKSHYGTALRSKPWVRRWIRQPVVSRSQRSSCLNTEVTVLQSSTRELVFPLFVFCSFFFFCMWDVSVCLWLHDLSSSPLKNTLRNKHTRVLVTTWNNKVFMGKEMPDIVLSYSGAWDKLLRSFPVIQLWMVSTRFSKRAFDCQ